PEGELRGPVAYLGCNDSYRSGVYRLEDMTVPVFGPNSAVYPQPLRSGPPNGALPEQLVQAAQYVVLDPVCYPTLPIQTSAAFVLAAKRRVVRADKRRVYLEIWMRSAAVQA